MNKGKNRKTQRYSCSNPNCGKAFSRPKIIKYYVCPSCQTLIDTPDQKIPLKPVICEKIMQVKKSSKQEKQKAIKKNKKQEPIKINLPANPPINDIEPEIAEKSVLNEPLEIKPAYIEESRSTYFDLKEESQEPKSELKEKADPMLDPQCEHYFGYLSERDKGEGIPEKCFECPKSIECMLSEYNKSKESVEAIKKWYPF